jgi:protein ImuB
MTLAAATALLPNLRHFSFDPEAERGALLSLGEALLSVAPAFQLSAPDGLWLDASAALLFGGEKELASRVFELCAAGGFRTQVAIASEAFTARTVARYSSTPLQRIDARGSAGALFPLPLKALEEIDLAASTALASLGLTTLGEVASLPIGALVARMGAVGLQIHRLCRGEDDAAIVPAALPVVMEESVDLDWPAESIEPLLFGLKTTLDRLCARLCGRKRAAVRLSVFLRLDPSGDQQLPLVLARPSVQVRLLLELIKHRISELTLPNPVVGIRVRVDESCEDSGRQLKLGDEPQGDAALEVVLSRLATALGEDSLFSAELKPVHRPEGAYLARRFQPPEPEKGLIAEAKRTEPDQSEWDEVLVHRPARLFERPASLEVDLGQNGDFRSARLLGKRRKAVAVVGPERLTGEWWGETAYSRDYYRVHFEGFGPAWIYRDARDGQFYLHGMFD